MRLVVSFLCFVFFCLQPLFPQGTWVKKADYPGCFTHSQIAFVVGGKGYVGIGADWCIEIWEYSPLTDLWTQKSDFPGSGVSNRPVSFAIGDKGYVCLGDDNAGNYSNILWEYDYLTDTWLEKTPFPGLGRGVAVSFVIDQKAYVGTGEFYDNQGQQILKDFWAYDQSTDTWLQIADMPIPLVAAVAFSAAGKGFVGSGGNDTLPLTNNFYSYDPVTNSWVQIQDVPRMIPTALATGFSIGNQGYFGMGLDDAQLFFEYNPYSGEWVQQANYPDIKAYDEGIGFSIGDKGYMGLGDDITGSSAMNRSFYEFTPDSIIISSIKTVTDSRLDFNVFPNPTIGNTVRLEIETAFSLGAMTINVQDVQGQLIKAEQYNQETTIPLNLIDLPKGLYFICIQSGDFQKCKKFIKM